MITDAVGDAGLITTTLPYRNVARGYLPLPVDTATDLQAQLEKINIHVTLDEQESATFIANSNAGKLTGLFLLGWGADYPDVTNFLDYHFGAGCTAAFGTCYPAIADPLTTGGQTSDRGGPQGGLRRGQQRASSPTFRWSRSRTPASPTRTSPASRDQQSRRSATSCCSG